jgi:hypothetical protein
LWIVQELHLAPHAIFWVGKLTIDRKVLWRLACYLERNKGQIACSAHEILGTSSTTVQAAEAELAAVAYDKALLVDRVIDRGNAELQTVLEVFSHKSCKDPRDKIFGLQALVKPAQRMPVNYAMSFETLLCTLLKFLCRPVRKRTSLWVWSVAFEEAISRMGCLDGFFRTTDPSLLRRGNRAMAMAWSYLVSQMPGHVCWAHVGWRNWEWLWDQVSEHAQTNKQRAFADRLRELGHPYELSKYGMELDQLPRCAAASRTYRDELLEKPCQHCKILESKARSLLDRVSIEHGFLESNGFWYHEQDWPFEKASPSFPVLVTV